MAMAGVGVGILIFFVFLSARLNTADLSLLYGDLDSGDSSKIISKLEAMGVPFELRGDGRQVMVPSDRVLRLRMSMAEDGLPNGGSIGYEIFDRSESFGTTNFVQNVSLVRALEGELARTIRALAQVTEARVHLVLPKRQVFSRKQQDATASVIIKSKGPKKLGKTQVLSIQHLVASAVPSLKVSRISVIDHRGRLLARAGSSGEDGLASAANNDEVQRSHEERLVRVLEELLEQSVGIGRIRAQVTAEMNFDRITTNSEIYDPDGQVVRSTQNVEENANSSEARNSRSVSVANNLPDASATNDKGDNSNASRSGRIEETINYEISKTIRQHVREMGTVRRLSVAILVDGTYSTDEDGNRNYKPRAVTELQKLEKLAKSAVGFNKKRGDTLEVINMQFVNALDDEIETVEPLFGLSKADYFRIAEIFVLAAVGILVILLVIRPLVARTLEAIPSALAAATDQNLLADQSADSPALTGPSETGYDDSDALDEEEMVDVARIDGKVRASALKKIEEIVERHPEETVGILRQWMGEDS
jgi:flagellar M-ring protein FliF